MLDSGRRALRPLSKSFPRYAVVGLLSVAVDVGILAALHSGAQLRLWIAQLIAWTVALAVNYSLNHVWSFGAVGQLRQRLLRYSVVIAANLGVTLAVVLGLTRVGLYYLEAKVVAVAITATINFTGYRYWVFEP